jgi:type I restriction enzyme, S subunit
VSELELKRRDVRQRLIDANEFPIIPENWGVERLRFLFAESKERNGKSPVGEMLSVSEYHGVVPREYEDEDQKRTDEELENYRVVRPGQLAVNSMWLNHLGLGVSEHTGYVSPAYNVYDVSDRLDYRFAHHLMRSNYYLKIYLRYLYGIRPNSFQIKSNDWASIPIIVPDLTTQRQIADFLDRETARIDLLIDKKQQLVALLGEKQSETVRQSVSWGLDPAVSKKPSQVPAGDGLAAHWTEQRLSTICRFVQGKAHEPFIEDDGKYICVTARFVSTNGEKFRRCTKNLTPGKMNDIAMVMSDLPNGRALARAFLIDQDKRYAINQRVCAITVMAGDPRFFVYQLDRNFQLLRYNDGFNQTHLPNRAFTQLFLKVPPVKEQKRIADHLDAVSQNTAALTEKLTLSIDRLKEYRSALITAAVTGQIDVSTWDKQGKTERHLEKLEAEASQ